MSRFGDALSVSASLLNGLFGDSASGGQGAGGIWRREKIKEWGEIMLNSSLQHAACAWRDDDAPASIMGTVEEKNR